MPCVKERPHWAILTPAQLAIWIGLHQRFNEPRDTFAVFCSTKAYLFLSTIEAAIEEEEAENAEVQAN